MFRRFRKGGSQNVDVGRLSDGRARRAIGLSVRWPMRAGRRHEPGETDSSQGHERSVSRCVSRAEIEAVQWLTSKSSISLFLLRGIYPTSTQSRPRRSGSSRAGILTAYSAVHRSAKGDG